ncbi:low affinity iron permease family protein [Flavobacterium sp.]|uniref:low affinity iron permease family protein n=1 Tax=Flavobacterium sp. TaxID=239 RepID=UPI0026249859|nr:low affinity iron permease family protein [Flavobacterium sp.]
MNSNNKKRSSGFEKISSVVTRAAGSTAAFVISFSIVLIWIVSGPFFNFSDTWQLVINTGTTIVTFLMVFLIQRSQNKDSIAIHLKLNELIVAKEMASNRLVSIEDINESDLIVLKKFYKHIAKLAENDESVEESHSLKEADLSHKRKKITNQKTKKS